MKKIIVSTTLLMCLFLSSCGGGAPKALDINVADLETACDFVDALELVVDEMQVIVDSGDVEGENETQLNKLIDKGDEINEAAEANFPRSEAEKCPNWDSFREKSRALEDYI